MLNTRALNILTTTTTAVTTIFDVVVVVRRVGREHNKYLYMLLAESDMPFIAKLGQCERNWSTFFGLYATLKYNEGCLMVLACICMYVQILPYYFAGCLHFWTALAHWDFLCCTHPIIEITVIPIDIHVVDACSRHIRCAKRLNGAEIDLWFQRRVSWCRAAQRIVGAAQLLLLLRFQLEC